MSSKVFRTILQVGITACAFTVASAAGAQVTTFSSRELFLAALDNIVSNDLNTVADGATTIPFATFGNATLAGATVERGRIDDNGGMSAFTLTFGQLLNGFGADFSQTNNSTVTLSFFNGTTALGSASLVISNAGSNFLGGTTITGFNRVEVAETTTGTFRSDNFAVGTNGGVMNLATVPEPASVALFATGLVALGGVTIRRKRTTG